MEKEIEDNFEELETKRLLLRKITDEDTPMLYENIFNNFEWFKFYYQLPFSSLEEYQQLVAKYKQWYENGNHFRWEIVEKQKQEMIGLVQLHTKDSLNNNCKMGYIIGYNYNKKGYAKEATQAVLNFAFNKLGYHRIEANIVVDNVDSINLAESLNMQLESIKKESYKLENDYYDQKVYVLLQK